MGCSRLLPVLATGAVIFVLAACSTDPAPGAADASGADADGQVPDGSTPDGSAPDVSPRPDASPGALYGYCDRLEDQPGGRWNSCEPGCDGSNPDYLYCDDFEDGQWAEVDCDGYFMGTREYVGHYADLPGNDQWCLTIYVPGEHQFGAAYEGNPAEVRGQAYGRCDGAGVGGTNCAVTSTNNSGTTKMMGSREFPDRACHDEVYIRFYVKPLAGYVHGHEKSWVSFQDDRRAGIWTGNIHHPFGSDALAWQPVGSGETDWRYQNMNGDETPLVAGEWNFVEIHYRLNTPGVADGTVEMWVDNCGPEGDRCTGTPTLKMQYHDMMMRAAGDNGQICGLWYENWSNASSVGEKYYDQLVVATAGPIGFCESCVP